MPSAADPPRRSLPAALPLAGLCALAVAARWAARSPVVYNWDSVHYVLAQERYDLLAHQPHPPGSLFYVLLARWFAPAAGPHEALLLISALSGAGLVGILYLLAREMGGESAGWIAASVAAFAPLFWFYGSVALNYAPSGVLAAAVALGCVRICLNRRPARGAWLAAAALGLLGGFRPTDAVFLAPAFLWSLACVARGPGGLRAAAGPAAAAALLTAGWLLPSIENAGGPAAYVASIRALDSLFAGTSVFRAGWPAWSEAVLTHRRSLESMLGAAWLLLAVAAVRRAKGGGWSMRPGIAVLGFLITAPAALFFLLGHFNSPGYTLVYAGFLAAAAAAGIARAFERLSPAALAAGAASTAVANGFLFLLGWPGADRLGQRSLSRVEIRDHARYYTELREYLEGRYLPGEVRLLASWTSTDGLRVIQYLIPEFADDTALLVEREPSLPAIMERVRFMRFTTPERLESERRPVYAVVRTREDDRPRGGPFPAAWEGVPIGPGHRLLRLRPERSLGRPPGSD